MRARGLCTGATGALEHETEVLNEMSAPLSGERRKTWPPSAVVWGEGRRGASAGYQGSQHDNDDPTWPFSPTSGVAARCTRATSSRSQVHTIGSVAWATSGRPKSAERGTDEKVFCRCW